MGRRSNRATRCAGCRMQLALCICAFVRPVPTASRWLMLQHPRERWRSTNTGQLTLRVLPNSQRCEWVSRVEPPQPPLDAQGREVFVLFPSGDGVHPEELADRLDDVAVLVLDASWGEARKMARWLPQAQGRKVALPSVAAPRGNLREAAPGGLSTADAVAWVLQAFGETEAAEVLSTAHRKMLERTLASRGQPLVDGPRLVGERLVAPDGSPWLD